MFQTKVVEKIKTHFVFSNFFFEIFPFMRKRGKNNVERGRPHMAVRCMRIACRVAKATNTHSEYVILIAFPLQRWLHESASVSRYTYTD